MTNKNITSGTYNLRGSIYLCVRSVIVALKHKVSASITASFYFGVAQVHNPSVKTAILTSDITGIITKVINIQSRKTFL
jgi:hypothetical protein